MEKKEIDIRHVLNKMKEDLKKVNPDMVFGEDIKFPISIKKVVFRDPIIYQINPNQVVGIRPKSDTKTYKGLYIGDIPYSYTYEYDKKKKVLFILPRQSSLFYIMDLKKTIKGSDSWWYSLDNEDNLVEIKDSDIDYQGMLVKALDEQS